MEGRWCNCKIIKLGILLGHPVPQVFLQFPHGLVPPLCQTVLGLHRHVDGRPDAIDLNKHTNTNVMRDKGRGRFNLYSIDIILSEEGVKDDLHVVLRVETLRGPGVTAQATQCTSVLPLQLITPI